MKNLHQGTSGGPKSVKLEGNDDKIEVVANSGRLTCIKRILTACSLKRSFFDRGQDSDARLKPYELKVSH